MIPTYFKKLSEGIISSWVKKRSNYIIISPPMSDSYLFFKQLTDKNFIKSLLGEDAQRLRIAILDTLDFKSEMSFAHRVCKCWAVNENFINMSDPTDILHCATQEVTERGEIPVLIIKRFHEALSKLGEDIGTTLRNLEHDYSLKTVVELPVAINTLRTKREQEDRHITPFLVSDWGQGHTHKILKGYDINEINNIVKENDLNEGIAIPLLKMTSGLHGIVESLVQDLERVNENNFEPLCGSKADDLCRNIFEWFESANSDYYKKAIIDFADGQEKEKNLYILKSHDWADILINKKNELNFKMLTYPIRRYLDRNVNISSDIQKLRDMLSKNNFIKIVQFFEEKKIARADNVPHTNYGLDLANLCKDLSGIYNNSANWAEIKKKIDKIFLYENNITKEIKPHLRQWSNIANLLSRYFEQKEKFHNLRVEQFVCESKDVNVLDLLLLLQARLTDANKHDPFYALQAVISHPESLLQLYCYFKFKIKFWRFDGPEIAEKSITDFIKRPFISPDTSSTLGYATLLFISTYISINDDIDNALVKSFQDMEGYLKIYELRKDQVHSTAFIKNSEWNEYRDFCSTMILDIRKSLGLNKNDKLVLPKNIFEIYLDHLTYSKWE